MFQQWTSATAALRGCDAQWRPEIARYTKRALFFNYAYLSRQTHMQPIPYFNATGNKVVPPKGLESGYLLWMHEIPTLCPVMHIDSSTHILPLNTHELMRGIEIFHFHPTARQGASAGGTSKDTGMLRITAERG